MNFEGNTTSRQLHTDRSTIPVEWNAEMPVSLVVRQEQSLDYPGHFADESEYGSLFQASQERLDRINFSIARISPFFRIRRAPRRVLPMPPIQCGLTVVEPAPDARPASAR
jgi:hypothetical protein